MWSKLAIISFFLALGLILFNIFDVFLGFGTSKVFSLSPKSLVDFFGIESFEWLKNIPSYWIQTIAAYVVQVTLFAVLIYISVFSLLVYFIIPEGKDKGSVPLKTRPPQKDR